MEEREEELNEQDMKRREKIGLSNMARVAKNKAKKQRKKQIMKEAREAAAQYFIKYIIKIAVVLVAIILLGLCANYILELE